MRFMTHKEVPTKYRKYLLEETGERRIKGIDIRLVNELCDEFDDNETENEKLKDFKLHVQSRPGAEVRVLQFGSFKDAEVALDRELGYTLQNKKVTAVITQAGRPVKAFERGRILTTRSMYG